MNETAVLLLALVVASVAVIVSVALSLARVTPPGSGRQRALPAHVLCPRTGNLARVEIGLHAESGRLSVMRCQHFPDGVFECDRECFPTLILTPLLEASAA